MEIVYRKLEELNKLDNNPRTITPEDMEKLKESIRNNPDYLEARPLVLSDRTGELVIIDGNQRYEACLQLGLKEVPTVLLHGLSEEREKEIVIRANVNNGKWDLAKLMEWDYDKLLDWGIDDIDFPKDILNKPEERKYTQKIDPPVYEAQQENAPPVCTLFNVGKFEELISDIEESDVPDDVKDFLRKAATRHIVFNYGKIAEYYAHASKEVQELMEDSALVIIDLDASIEKGYTRLRDDIYEIMLEDTEDEE